MSRVSRESRVSRVTCEVSHVVSRDISHRPRPEDGPGGSGERLEREQSDLILPQYLASPSVSLTRTLYFTPEKSWQVWSHLTPESWLSTLGYNDSIYNSNSGEEYWNLSSMISLESQSKRWNGKETKNAIFSRTHYLIVKETQRSHGFKENFLQIRDLRASVMIISLIRIWRGVNIINSWYIKSKLDCENWRLSVKYFQLFSPPGWDQFRLTKTREEKRQFWKAGLFEGLILILLNNSLQISQRFNFEKKHEKKLTGSRIKKNKCVDRRHQTAVGRLS